MNATVSLLLVEDEALILHLLEDALTDAGFTVVVANSGAEAISVLDHADNAIAGLVTDVGWVKGRAVGASHAMRARQRRCCRWST